MIFADEHGGTIIMGLIAACTTIFTVFSKYKQTIKDKELDIRKLQVEEESKRKDREAADRIREFELQKIEAEAIASRKQREAETKAAELIAFKEDMNKFYQKWKEIAEEYKAEKNDFKKQLDEKCAECVSLKIQLAEKNHV